MYTRHFKHYFNQSPVVFCIFIKTTFRIKKVENYKIYHCNLLCLHHMFQLKRKTKERQTNFNPGEVHNLTEDRLMRSGGAVDFIVNNYNRSLTHI